MIAIIIVIIIIIITIGVSNNSCACVYVEVFCTSETFRAACQRGYVVIVRRALYGRLAAGRCITSEYAHALGCYADVTAHVQDACSGAAWRQNCSLLVATVDAIAQPCGKDFKSYLDIEHDCVAGMTQAVYAGTLLGRSTRATDPKLPSCSPTNLFENFC